MQVPDQIHRQAADRRIALRAAVAAALGLGLAVTATPTGAATTYTFYGNNGAHWSDSTFDWGPNYDTIPSNNPGDIITFSGGNNRSTILDRDVTIGQIQGAPSGQVWITTDENVRHTIMLDNTGGASNPLGTSNAYLGTDNDILYIGSSTLSKSGVDLVLNGNLDIASLGTGSVKMRNGATITGTGNINIRSSSDANTELLGLNNTGAVINNSTGTGDVRIFNGGIGPEVTQIVQNSAISSLRVENSSHNLGGSLDSVHVDAGTFYSYSDSLAGIDSTTTFRINYGATYENRGTTIAGLNDGPDGGGRLLIVAGGRHDITLEGDGNYAFSGDIVPDSQIPTATLRLVKKGGGTQVLSGNIQTVYAYAEGGTLLVDGSLTAPTVEVKDGGTLGGSGTIDGNVNLRADGTLSPGGDTPGTLTITGNLYMSKDASIQFDPGDLIEVDGKLQPTNYSYNWNVLLGNGFADGGEVVLFDYGTLGSNPSLNASFDLSNLGFTPSESLYLSDTGSQLVINGISVVPEPASVALLAMGTGLLLARRRRPQPFA